jgi:hypothetical protein
MNPTPTDESPVLREWLSQRHNQTVYLKRGQVQELLTSCGVSREKVDDLWPTGNPAKKHLRGVRHALYVRRCVLADLGVSDPFTRP